MVDASAFVSDPSRAGIFIDFDGTLSEIVPIPSEARPVAGAQELLQVLAGVYAVVAVVSGRAAQELLDWLGPDIEIWGVHGAQRTLNGAVVLSDGAAAYQELMSLVKQEALQRVEQLGLPGVIVEDKGVMLGLHYRAAADPTRAREAIGAVASELAERHGLQNAVGRYSFELRPPAEFSKASVVLQRSREAGLLAVAFIGDDRVDLPGFDALDVLAAEGVATLRVAVDSPEAPDELLRRSDEIVDGPAGALDFLRALLA